MALRPRIRSLTTWLMAISAGRRFPNFPPGTTASLWEAPEIRLPRRNLVPRHCLHSQGSKTACQKSEKGSANPAITASCRSRPLPPLLCMVVHNLHNASADLHTHKPFCCIALSTKSTEKTSRTKMLLHMHNQSSAISFRHWTGQLLTGSARRHTYNST